MKKFALILSAALLASLPAFAAETKPAAPSASASVSGKVAVVNVQQILQQSPRVAELSKKLDAQFKERQQKISDGQKNLQDQADKFKKDAPTLSKQDRDAFEKKISDQRADLMKQVMTYQQDLNKEQGKVMQGILSDLNKIVTKIAKNKSYPLVLEAGAVVFAPEGNDITSQVLDEFNKAK